MKTLKSLFISLSLLSGLAACQDDIVHVDEFRDENTANTPSTGAPVITQVSDYNDYMNNESSQALTNVVMDSYVVIEGENLEGLKMLVFNSDTLNLREIHAQWDYTVFKVPAKLPAVINNKLSYTTKFGTATTELKLQLPGIEIDKMVNAFQLQGEQTQILGKNFSLYGFDQDRSKVYLSDASGYNKSVDLALVSDTCLQITLPTDAPNNALISFELDGEISSHKLYYRPIDLLLFGGESPAMSGAISPNVSYTDGSTDGAPVNLITEEVIEGVGIPKFIRYVGTAPASGWYNVFQIKTDIAFEIAEGKKATDYYFVYEFCANKGQVPVGKSYMASINGSGAVGLWEDYGKEVIQPTKEWKTHRVDLSTMKFMYGNTIETIIFKVSPEAKFTEVDHSFANFRIELKQPE